MSGKKDSVKDAFIELREAIDELFQVTVESFVELKTLILSMFRR